MLTAPNALFHGAAPAGAAKTPGRPALGAAATVAAAVGLAWTLGGGTARPAHASATTRDPSLYAAGMAGPNLLPQRVAVTFKYVAPRGQPAPRAVYVRGDFNEWSHSATPLHRVSTGTWAARVQLLPGIYRFGFTLTTAMGQSVGSRRQPLRDRAANPGSWRSLPNAFGAVNDMLAVPWPWRHFPAAGPNQVPTAAIAFNPGDWRYCDVVSSHVLRLRVLAQEGGLSSATVMLKPPHGPWRGVPLERQGSIQDTTTWGTVLRTAGSKTRYYFALTHGTQTLYLADGRFRSSPLAAAEHPYVCKMRSAVVTPDWAKHAVWYQIWVGRFRDGSPGNDQPGIVPWRWPWYKPYRNRGGKFNAAQRNFNRDYGGNLQGVQQELPYLRRLGVNALYLNPVFEAAGVVKYAPEDYRHIDDGYAVRGSRRFLHGEKVGAPATWQWSQSDLLFLRFLSVAHRQGFKVILDVPFHHCGPRFGPFQDVLEHGRKSRYAGWFRIAHWGPPVRYIGLGGVADGVPVFAHYPSTGLAPGLCRYFFTVTRRWLAPNGNPAAGVDGWRLDMAGSIPHPFWIAWRKVINDVKPKALVVGELWTSAQAWLNKGNQLEGAENYPFANLAMLFFVDQCGPGKPGVGPRRFGRGLQDLLNRYPYQVDLVQLNLLDSQDPCRFVSRFAEPDRTYWPPSSRNGLQPSAQAYLRLRQVVALQVAFPGAPMFLYGDEAGMYSASGYPLNCQPMWWRDLMPYGDPHVRIHERLLHFYRRAIAARRLLPALQTGFYGQLVADSRRDVFGFHRDLGNQHVYVLFNRSPAPQWVKVPIFASDRGRRLFNYLSRRQMKLVYPPAGDVAGRPILRRRKGAHGYLARGRDLIIRIRPWGSAILARYVPGDFGPPRHRVF